MFFIFVLMHRRHPRLTRTETFFPCTTLFRSLRNGVFTIQLGFDVNTADEHDNVSLLYGIGSLESSLGEQRNAIAIESTGKDVSLLAWELWNPAHVPHVDVVDLHHVQLRAVIQLLVGYGGINNFFRHTRYSLSACEVVINGMRHSYISVYVYCPGEAIGSLSEGGAKGLGGTYTSPAASCLRYAESASRTSAFVLINVFMTSPIS